MARLSDRIRRFGCEALRPYHLVSEADQAKWRRQSRDQFLAEAGDQIEDKRELERLAEYAGSTQAMVSNAPIATEVFEPDQLNEVPVFAADEVAAYCAALPAGTKLQDVVSTVAPPFERFFIEFQGVDNSLGLHSWGVLAEQVDVKGDSDDAGWHVLFRLIVERGKNAPIGPALNLIFPLDREGHLIVKDGDELASGVWLPPMKPEDPPQEVVKQTADSLMEYMLPAFMTVSFLHCRNVGVKEVEPDPGQAKRWTKKGGEPLVQYHVLEVGTMRAVLEEEGESGSKGLRHALHVCRGHFKTFDEAAPLFGRATGTFWWADQVRGSSKQGEVVKDYAVRAPGAQFGRDYVAADEQPELAAVERTGPDPDAAGRGLAAHNRTQNLLAQTVEAAGLRPRSPAPGEPNFDLAWEAEGVIRVAEVKSITPENEERQLRMALGQVVRYRQQLRREDREAQALIALEREPTDPSWRELCAEQGIVLCWPETFEQAVVGQTQS